VAKGAGSDRFGDASGACGFPDGPLNGRGVQVVASDDAGTGVQREARGREDPLPTPLSFGVGVFTGQGFGEVNGTVTLVQVLLVETPNLFQVVAEGILEESGEDSDAVFFPFAVPNSDGTVFKVQVFNPQAECFHQAEATTVEELGD
jgi:hypothetical protein